MGLLISDRPRPFFDKAVDDVQNFPIVEHRMPQGNAEHALDLRIRESNDPVFKFVQVDIRSQGSVWHRRVRVLDHFGPCFGVMIIHLLRHFVEMKLGGE
jgi:hypothetical protein